MASYYLGTVLATIWLFIALIPSMSILSAVAGVGAVIVFQLGLKDKKLRNYLTIALSSIAIFLIPKSETIAFYKDLIDHYSG